jgi:Ribbon-helix-helix protein, copG family
VVHTQLKIDYNDCVPQEDEQQMISARDSNAELVKVFLLKEEKAAFKQLAAQMGKPMYQIIREMVLEKLANQL